MNDDHSHLYRDRHGEIIAHAARNGTVHLGEPLGCPKCVTVSSPSEIRAMHERVRSLSTPTPSEAQ